MIISDDLKLAISAAKAASQIIQNGFGKVLNIEDKENGKGIVTEIDKASEDAIIKILKNGLDYGILAEESGENGKLGDSYWVIDPLDGTTNFAQGLPLFAVSIALVKNNSVVIGVTLYPVSGDIYLAEKGQGAYLNDQPIHVSKRSDKAVIILNKGYDKYSDINFIKLTQTLSPYFVTRRLGSSTLEMAFTAAGVTEGFLSSFDDLWDYAAGALLVKEAGGIVTDWEGKDWTIESKHILAANPIFHEDLLKKIKNIGNLE